MLIAASISHKIMHLPNHGTRKKASEDVKIHPLWTKKDTVKSDVNLKMLRYFTR